MYAASREDNDGTPISRERKEMQDINNAQPGRLDQIPSLQSLMEGYE